MRHHKLLEGLKVSALSVGTVSLGERNAEPQGARDSRCDGGRHK